MDVPAKLTSKGQLTVPKQVRDALGLRQGDEVVFHLDDQGVSLRRTPDFLELAGSVEVPPALRGLSWKEIRDRGWPQAGATRDARTRRRR